MRRGFDMVAVLRTEPRPMHRPDGADLLLVRAHDRLDCAFAGDSSAKSRAGERH
jgi:hypothetical protein